MTKKILIAEDNTFLANAYREKLSEEGYDITIVGDGGAALKALEESSYDLFILDITMPVKSGFEVLEEMNASGNQCPVIIASNLGSRENIERGMSLGAKDYIVKSDLSMNGLLEKIKSSCVEVTDSEGFTLIELLIGMSFLIILLSVVLVAANPSHQLARENNLQRKSDVAAILNAVSQYATDNNGSLAAINAGSSLPGDALNISNDDVDICSALVPKYIERLPYDPTATGAGFVDCSNYDAKYNIYVNSSSNRVTVEASGAELGVTISVTK
ncbi:response regulator [Patescibacteria group bacterium]